MDKIKDDIYPHVQLDCEMLMVWDGPAESNVVNCSMYDSHLEFFTFLLKSAVY